jgi:hypothetical protein
MASGPRTILKTYGWREFLRWYRWQALSLLLLLCVIGTVVALVTKGNSKSSPAQPLQRYAGSLAAVPTNRVTGSGTATVQLRGETASITLNTTGLLNGSPHLAHIHGLGLGTCPTASSARPHNGHLTISTGDAIRLYGSTLTSFTEWGSTSGSVPNNIDMPRYPASGNIRYRRTTTVTPLAADLIRDGDAVIVVHGIDYNHNHIYDFGLGVSDLDKTLPGEATAPALCGPLHPLPGANSATSHSERGSSATTYTASLAPLLASRDGQTPSDVSYFCHIAQVGAPSASRPPSPPSVQLPA